MAVAAVINARKSTAAKGSDKSGTDASLDCCIIVRVTNESLVVFMGLCVLENILCMGVGSIAAASNWSELRRSTS